MLILLVALATIVGLILIETPIAFAFGAGVLVMSFLYGIDISYFFQSAQEQIGSFALLAVPLFILAGALMSDSGISDRLVDFVESLVGRFRGALGSASVLACAIFGAISGSGAAAISAIGSILIPRMVRAGYPREYAAALVGCSSVISLMIPPSIPMIIFALSANLPVAACFLATVLPGLGVAASYCIINTVYVSRRPNIEKRSNDAEARIDIVVATKRAFFALLMPFIMLGGIYSGAFTPTEAAGVVVIYTLFVGFFVYRALNLTSFSGSVVRAATQTGAFILIIFFIFNFSRILALEDIPRSLSNGFLSVSDNKIVILLLINLLLLVIGMLIDDVSGGIVAAVILLPAAMEIGIHPIHFAAIVGVNLGLGNITPPCAPLLFMAGDIGKVPFLQMLRPTLFLSFFGHLPWVFAVTFLPDLSLWLPRALLGIH